MVEQQRYAIFMVSNGSKQWWLTKKNASSQNTSTADFDSAPKSTAKYHGTARWISAALQQQLDHDSDEPTIRVRVRVGFRILGISSVRGRRRPLQQQTERRL
jgi:hypothetical protein